MPAQPLPEFDEVVARLERDLNELESVSLSLKNIQSYADALRSMDKQFSQTLSEIHSIAERTLEALEEAVQNSENSFKAIIHAVKDDLAQSSQSLSSSTDRLEAELSRMAEVDFPKRFEEFRELLLSAQETTNHAALAGLSARDLAEQAKNTSESVDAKAALLETRVKDVERAVTLLQSEIGNLKNFFEREVSRAQAEFISNIKRNIMLNRYTMVALFVVVSIVLLLTRS